MSKTVFITVELTVPDDAVPLDVADHLANTLCAIDADFYESCDGTEVKAYEVVKKTMVQEQGRNGGRAGWQGA